ADLVGFFVSMEGYSLCFFFGKLCGIDVVFDLYRDLRLFLGNCIFWFGQVVVIWRRLLRDHAARWLPFLNPLFATVITNNILTNADYPRRKGSTGRVIFCLLANRLLKRVRRDIFTISFGNTLSPRQAY